MDAKAKKLVEALREDAEWAHANEWETPITLGDHLYEAANMIEHLDEENAGLDMLLTSAQSAAETWQRRAEAAERDIRAMLCEDSSTVLCKYCAHLKNDDCVWMSEKCSSIVEWRGLCAENGGNDHAE